MYLSKGETVEGQAYHMIQAYIALCMTCLCHGNKDSAVTALPLHGFDVTNVLVVRRGLCSFVCLGERVPQVSLVTTSSSSRC